MRPVPFVRTQPPQTPIVTYSDLLMNKLFRYMCVFFLIINPSLAFAVYDDSPIASVFFIVLTLVFWWIKAMMKSTSVSVTPEGVWIDYGMWMRWISLENVKGFVVLPRKRYSPLGIETREDHKKYLIPLTQNRKMSSGDGDTKDVLGALNAQLQHAAA